jgi:uncharacterized iron-regulated membrane protein
MKQLRNLKSEKEQREQDKKTDLAEYDSVTKKLKDELKSKEDQHRPDDMMKRLEDILIQCAVIPSARRGLLGSLSSIAVSGDGSALPTGANSNGKPVCDCRKSGVYNWTATGTTQTPLLTGDMTHTESVTTSDTPSISMWYQPMVMTYRCM